MMRIPRLTLCIFVGLVAADILKHSLVLSSGLMQPWGDAVAYWNLGADIASGDVFMLDSAIGYRTLGYPWFVGVCQLLGSSGGLLLLAIIQHVAAMATNGLVAWSVWRITKDVRWSAAGYALAIFNTSRAFYASWVLTETLATIVGFGICLLLWHHWGKATRKNVIEVSLMVGTAILLRPSFLILLPLLFAFLWFNPSQRWKSYLIAFLTIGCCLAPCYARNYYLFGKWKLVTFQGRELWTATFSPYPGAGIEIPQVGAGAELRARLQNATAEINLRHNWGVSSFLQRSGMSDADIDQLMSDVSLQAIRQNPFEVAKAFLTRTLTYWYCWNWPPPRAEHTPSDLANQLGYRGNATAARISSRIAWTPENFRRPTVLYSMLTLVCASLMILFRQVRLVGAIAFYYLLASTVLTAALEIPNYRYRMPLEPVQALVMVAAAFTLWHHRSSLLRMSVRQT